MQYYLQDENSNLDWNIVFAAILLINSGCMCRVIYRDAKVRDFNHLESLMWGVGSIFIPIIFFPLYIYYATRRSRTKPITTHESWTVWLYITLLFAMTTAVLIIPPSPRLNIRANAVLIPIYGIVAYYIIFKINRLDYFVTDERSNN